MKKRHLDLPPNQKPFSDLRDISKKNNREQSLYLY